MKYAFRGVLLLCTLLNLHAHAQESQARVFDTPADILEQKISTTRVDSTMIGSQREVVAASDDAHQNRGIDSIGITTHSWQVTVVDSIRQIATYMDEREIIGQTQDLTDSTRRGHYLQAMIGGGYSQLGYHPENGSHSGHGAAALQIQYAYFFHQNWGISIGLGASHYGGQGINSFTASWSDQTDTDGEAYEHRIDARQLRESQHIWMLDVPFMLQWQHIFNPKFGMYITGGVNLGVPISTTYRLRDGEVEHIGYYDAWKMEVHDHRDFYTETVGNGLSNQFQKSRMLLPQAGLTADLGFLFPLEKNVDLMLGFYARYTANNIQRKDVEPAAFMHTEYTDAEAYKNHSFMEREYAGMIGTTQVSSVHPWQVGIKLGVQWHPIKHREYTPVTYEAFAVYDTTVVTRPRIVEAKALAYDTILTPVYEIRQLMEKSIIWFDLNSYVPKLDPVDILEQMAAVLIANPELRVEVNGHTCTIGQRAYNQTLSEKRAKAVADRLIALGVNPAQLICHGYCSDKPYFSTSHQLYLDRRCEIIPIEGTNTKKVRKN